MACRLRSRCEDEHIFANKYFNGSSSKRLRFSILSSRLAMADWTESLWDYTVDSSVFDAAQASEALVSQEQVGVDSQKEDHAVIERRRRKELNQLFDRIRAELPESSQQMSRSALLDEFAKYIQSLQQELEDLSARRLLLSRNQSVKINVRGSNVLVTVASNKQRHLLSKILLLISEHQSELISASMSTDDSSMFHHIHVKIRNPDFSSSAFQTSLQQLIDHA